MTPTPPRGGGARGDLSGRVALVTGGARNIGRAIATALAERGAYVLVNYFHSHEEAKETLRDLRARGARADLLRASVARPEQVTRMFAEIERRVGRLDVLVNNAADGALLPVDEVTDAHLDRALETNLKGGLRCARAAAPLMERHGGGSIVTVSALGGSQLVMANYLACAPAKAAAEAATRYLAVELAPRDIRVNTASAAMLTSPVADAFPRAGAMRRAIADATPLGQRLGTPEEFAEVVAFLASDSASWITGQLVLADGGLSLGAPLLSPGAEDPAADPVPAPPPAAVAPGAEPAPPAPEPSASPAGTEPSASPSRPPAPEPAVTGVRATTEPGAAVAEPRAGSAAAATGAVGDGTGGEEIAVVGMGLAVSGASDPEEFWALRTTGRELFTEVPPDRWDRARFSSPDHAEEDKSYQDTCVFITDFRPEPAALEGLSTEPDEAELTTLWLRHSLVQALDGVRRTERDRFSFHVGYTADGSQHLEEAGILASVRHLMAEATADPELRAAVGRVLSRRYHRGAGTPRFLPHQVGEEAMAGILPGDTRVQMVDTACSSSLYAIDLGMKDLLSGARSIAVCGGAFALAPRGTVLFSKLKGLSRRGAVHALDAEADGVIFADGAGVVVLKRLSRARADGDRVLGVLTAFGASSDGRGKAIYAPSSTGQDLAVRRALAPGGTGGTAVDWVNAHATGTPVGDLAEFTTLREHYGTERPALVTSNKSLIGHTGWAAGVVSLAECLLGLREETVPGQFRFRSAPEAFALDSTRLEITAEPRPWTPRADGSPRTAAISGFGFGGTNAHLLVTEPGAAAHRPAGPAAGPAPAPAERIALVGWSARLPGAESPARVREWLAGDLAVDPGWGETYPAPPFQQVRMPPATVRAIDRCQLMAVQCAHALRDQLPEFWREHAARTGVVLGNMGPTRAAMRYAARCYLDDVEHALRTGPETAHVPELPGLLERLRERVRDAIPPSNEDSFPGIMPNIISARVANTFDLHGPNLTVDAGLASTLSAFGTAMRYLRSGELDFVLAGGINGNSLPEYGDLLTGVLGREPDAAGPPPTAEGAFLFALTTESRAREAGLPVLALVDEAEREDGTERREGSGGRSAARLDCGPAGAYSRYLGASGGPEILRALLGIAAPDGTVGPVELSCHPRGAGTAADLLITPLPAPGGQDADGADGAGAANGPGSVGAPTSPAAATPGAGEASDTVRRYVPELRPDATEPTGPVGPAVPDGAVLLTDRPALAAEFAGAAHGTTVLSTAPLSGERPGWHHVQAEPEAVRRALAAVQGPVRHLVAVTDLSAAVPPATAPTAEAAELTALHDLLFLVVQQRYAELDDPSASVVLALLGALEGERAHPHAGLFTGLAKCVGLELKADCLALLTGERAPAAAAALTGRERSTPRRFPVVRHAGGRRLVPSLVPRAAGPGGDPAQRPPLGPESVVVALGGARGITAELLVSLAERHRCRIHALGSNRIDDWPEEYFEGGDEEFAARRPAFIAAGVAAGEGTVAQLNRRFDRIVDARAARRNLARMAAHSGPDRVSYLPCDARDEDSVRTAIDTVTAAHGRIDLLVNAPGLNRSALIRDKDLAEFRRIRDLKLAAHRNLSRALAGRPPRLWCDFGSLLGYFGQLGEADYASGNDYLATVAEYAGRGATAGADAGATEFAIGWTLWDEVGMGSSALVRDYYRKAGSYSHMPVEEGVRHFLAELDTGDRVPSLVHLGGAERATVERFYPGFLDPEPGPGGHPPTASDAPTQVPTPASGPARAGEPATSRAGDGGRGRFYLRGGPEPEPDAGEHPALRFTCLFDPRTDAYLDHHRVRGVPTLPGTFVTEIAAEAALELVPGGRVVAFEELRFLRFLKVRADAHRTPKRITARVTDRVGDLTTVEVRVSQDVVAPSGVLLRADQPHFTVRVLLAPRFPEAPVWSDWDGAGERPVPDPYHAEAAPVLLTGPFRATTDTRHNPHGARARFQPPLAAETDGPWASFLMPVVLLDALARTGVLEPDGGSLPVAAPLSIRRVDLYQQANDLELLAAHGGLELYVTHPGFPEREAGQRPENRFVAVAPDGRVVAQLKGVDATVIGRFDTATGQIRPVEPTAQAAR
ncbi:SDR family oxidoreductase [Streptomyces sp. AJS327]|uniref:SDR family oxidoreductase n=1 Tax=Streptomyces sp. AJS327 TaxID=2545265 RepID=UPI0015DDDC3E|nr:SDR family oxidoreductase [Streptomyces sp. AJS327]MBA0050974.1 SDR family oxidoreductase [Streptomyces sp. AJS327]